MGMKIKNVGRFVTNSANGQIHLDIQKNKLKELELTREDILEIDLPKKKPVEMVISKPNVNPSLWVKKIRVG